jgi:hypothetical protein
MLLKGDDSSLSVMQYLTFPWICFIRSVRIIVRFLFSVLLKISQGYTEGLVHFYLEFWRLPGLPGSWRVVGYAAFAVVRVLLMIDEVDE